MQCHNQRAPVVSSSLTMNTVRREPVTLKAVCIAGLLLSGCATQDATVTIHIFGGRSMQEGQNNEMEAPSDVHDLIGDLDISSLPGRGGGEVSPATARTPEEVAPPAGAPSLRNSPPPSFSGSVIVSVEGDQTFLSKPISEKDGYWVILTPAKYNQTISDGGGLSVDEYPATFTGYANGNRGHWRLGTPGSGTNVEMILVDASGQLVKAWVVPNGGSRYETD